MSTSPAAGAAQVLQYDSSLLVPARYAAAAGPMLGLAVCSGVCVGVCFMAFRGGPAVTALHLLVGAMTLALAVLVGRRLSRAGAPADRRPLLDMIAGLGLLGVGIAPLGRELLGDDRLGDGAPALLGVAFLLMASTTVRHVLLYRMLAADCVDIGRAALARNFNMLGGAKAVYEGLWLGCCGAALLAIPVAQSSPVNFFLPLAMISLFGAAGFAILWAWMIVAHATFYAATRRRPAT